MTKHKITFKAEKSSDAERQTFSVEFAKLHEDYKEILMVAGFKHLATVGTRNCDASNRLAVIGSAVGDINRGDWPRIFGDNSGGDPVKKEMLNLALAYVFERAGVDTLGALATHPHGRSYVKSTAGGGAVRNDTALLALAERFDAAQEDETATLRARAEQIVAARETPAKTVRDIEF